MATETSSGHAQAGGVEAERRAVLVLDGAGRVIHADPDLGELVGARDVEDHARLAELLRPVDDGTSLPAPNERATVTVRARGSRERWLLSSHPLRTVAGEGLTVLVLAPDGTNSQPAIDRGIAAVLSHELRTPITTIYAGSQMLLRHAQLSAPEQREMLADIQLEADRLYRLVEDLLVANVGKGGIELVLEPILLQRALPRVVAIEAGRWPDVDFVTTIATELPAVSADELYVEHVVRDLLANAGAFSRQNGTVRLDARGGEGVVEVRVLDDGPGIHPAAEPALFRPFRGMLPVAGGRPGPGLGLYVCKLLVEAMGGRVWARGRPSGGSEFGFSLREYVEDADVVPGEQAAGADWRRAG